MNCFNSPHAQRACYGSIQLDLLFYRSFRSCSPHPTGRIQGRWGGTVLIELWSRYGAR